MKICIVSQTFAPQEEGGAEISARVGAIQLGKNHDVTVLALGKEGDPLVPPGEAQLAGGIRVVRLAWNNSYLPGSRKPSANIIHRAQWHLRTALGAICVEGLKAFLKREQFDLIYAQNSAYMQPALFQAAENAGTPVCLHLRDYALLCPKTSMFRRGDNCEKQCFDCSLLSKRMKTSGEGMTVIAVSHSLKKRFLQNGVLDKADWHVMHNRNTAQKCFDKSLLGRSKPATDTFTFGYLGNLTKEKGIRDLIDAFQALPNNRSARLIVAGRGRSSEEAYLRQAATQHNIDFRGFVAPQEVYRVADAVILPSLWHEPQSRILIEAPLHGIPIIGSARGGTPEVVEDQETGWCYDPAEPGALARLMGMALEIGQKEWWRRRDELFPGIANFQGTAEQSGYYKNLERILVTATHGEVHIKEYA